MAFFNSYVSLPEGTFQFNRHIIHNAGWLLLDLPLPCVIFLSRGKVKQPGRIPRWKLSNKNAVPGQSSFWLIFGKSNLCSSNIGKPSSWAVNSCENDVTRGNGRLQHLPPGLWYGVPGATSTSTCMGQMCRSFGSKLGHGFSACNKPW